MRGLRAAGQIRRLLADCGNSLPPLGCGDRQPRKPSAFSGVAQVGCCSPASAGRGHGGQSCSARPVLKKKRCPNCLSLWERPAAGRVRVPSAAVSATKVPSPRPSPRGRGRKIDDVQKGSYISNPSAEHHCQGRLFPRTASDSPGITGPTSRVAAATASTQTAAAGLPPRGRRPAATSPLIQLLRPASPEMSA